MMSSNRKKRVSKLGRHLFPKIHRRRQAPTHKKREDGPREVPEEPILNIYQASPPTCIAQIILNGYNIEQDESFGALGTMRSFKIVQGDLWTEWHNQTAVMLADAQGQEAIIRIAALPVEDDSFGLIEFVS